MRLALSIAKALADETRLRALMALRGGELCLCQLVELLELAPSTVSRHMNILHDAGLVSRRKIGRWAYFRLAGGDSTAAVKQALRWVRSSLAEDRRVARDEKALQRIRTKDLKELCRCYEKG